MEKFLAKGVGIICELHPVQLSSRGHSVEDVSDLLKHYGYRFYLVDERGLISTLHLLDDRTRHFYFSR